MNKNLCVHSYNRDVDETISWIKEKEQLMASDDFGRDLASVQALLRKHEGLERDLAALEDKARRCSTEDPHIFSKLKTWYSELLFCLLFLLFLPGQHTWW